MLNITVTLTADQKLLEVLGNLFRGVQNVPNEQTVLPAVKPTGPAPAAPTVKEEKSDITVEELRALVAQKAKSGKRDAIKTLLTSYEAESVSTLAAKDYIDFKTKLEAL